MQRRRNLAVFKGKCPQGLGEKKKRRTRFPFSRLVHSHGDSRAKGWVFCLATQEEPQYEGKACYRLAW